MQSENKLDWVKESFAIFIDKVRDQDFVSLIIFDDFSEVIYPSTQMNSEKKREQFRSAVDSIQTRGGTNLVAGLEAGYSQVFANYRSDYNNRVLFLTDGVGNSKGILEMAEQYLELGVNVSTIGLGSNFDVNLMIDLAKKGGGSSRFISDKEEMQETFGDELDRMIVPAAKNLKMKLMVPEWINISDTWGYRNEKSGHSVKYSLPTLHNGDYETILTEIQINPNNLLGEQIIATFYVEYDALDGKRKSQGPFEIRAELVNKKFPVNGVSDYTVLQSATMLYIGRAMIEIGELYYNNKNNITELNSLRYEQYNSIPLEEIPEPV